LFPGLSLLGPPPGPRSGPTTTRAKGVAGSLPVHSRETLGGPIPGGLLSAGVRPGSLPHRRPARNTGASLDLLATDGTGPQSVTAVGRGVTGDTDVSTAIADRGWIGNIVAMIRYSHPSLKVHDGHRELLVDLLNRRPGHSVDEHPEWFDSAWPELYMELVDLDLITGIEYELTESGGCTISVGNVGLTDEGRRIAEAARRSLAASPSRVFVSYAHDDSTEVDRLCDDLESAGVRTWRDLGQLLPGDDWKIAIRRAIESGTGFIACFSQTSEDRSRSYMREELTLAIEQLRQRPADSGWFIPVLLSDVDLPDIPLGGGRTLRDLHFVRWYESPSQALKTLLAAIDRLQR
jgi:hypothetical protein